jgi:hypothetical protein
MEYGYAKSSKEHSSSQAAIVPLAGSLLICLQNPSEASANFRGLPLARHPILRKCRGRQNKCLRNPIGDAFFREKGSGLYNCVILSNRDGAVGTGSLAERPVTGRPQARARLYAGLFRRREARDERKGSGVTVWERTLDHLRKRRVLCPSGVDLFRPCPLNCYET